MIVAQDLVCGIWIVDEGVVVRGQSGTPCRPSRIFYLYHMDKLRQHQDRGLRLACAFEYRRISRALPDLGELGARPAPTTTPRSMISASCASSSAKRRAVRPRIVDTPSLSTICAMHRAIILRNHWREAFERLVQQEHARVGHQRASDRQHLLLAPDNWFA